MKIRHSDEHTPSRLSGLYIGHAYTGKTEYICSWPNVALVAFDPDTSTADKHEGVTILEVATWHEFQHEVLPHVRNRTMHELCQRPVETVAIDTISLGAQRLAQEIQGHQDRLRIQDYEQLRQRLTEAALTLTDATRGDNNGKPSYHALFSAHLVDVTDDAGALRGVRPAIPGQFKDLLPRLVGFTFICESALEVRTEPGKPARQEQVYRVRTVPPDNFHVCGDRVGGGKYKRLPATTSGYYHDLMQAWGMSPGE